MYGKSGRIPDKERVRDLVWAAVSPNAPSTASAILIAVRAAWGWEESYQYDLYRGVDRALQFHRRAGTIEYKFGAWRRIG